MSDPNPRRLPPHELNARRARKRVLTRLPGLVAPPPPAACPACPTPDTYKPVTPSTIRQRHKAA